MPTVLILAPLSSTRFPSSTTYPSSTTWPGGTTLVLSPATPNSLTLTPA